MSKSRSVALLPDVEGMVSFSYSIYPKPYSMIRKMMRKRKIRSLMG